MLDAVSRKIGNVARDDVFRVIVRPQSTKYLIIKSIVGSYIRAAGAQVGIIGLSVNFSEICAIMLTIIVKITILTMERKYDKSSCCEKIRKR